MYQQRCWCSHRTELALVHEYFTQTIADRRLETTLCDWAPSGGGGICDGVSPAIVGKMLLYPESLLQHGNDSRKDLRNFGDGRLHTVEGLTKPLERQGLGP